MSPFYLAIDAFTEADCDRSWQEKVGSARNKFYARTKQHTLLQAYQPIPTEEMALIGTDWFREIRIGGHVQLPTHDMKS